LHIPRAALAVSKVVRNSQFPFGTYRHQGQRFDPAADHAGHREFSRFAAGHGAIEHGTVDKLTGVVNAYAVGTRRDRAFALRPGRFQMGTDYSAQPCLRRARRGCFYPAIQHPDL
jgi:hypothetical protein